ncbi:MAG: hypothetical protein MUC96_26490, partial [Myxococcaceae bacterium]|nr:hypothetical protein [Myxococcaceae bacterium]
MQTSPMKRLVQWSALIALAQAVSMSGCSCGRYDAEVDRLCDALCPNDGGTFDAGRPIAGGTAGGDAGGSAGGTAGGSAGGDAGGTAGGDAGGTAGGDAGGTAGG